jgi:hypothetical protein
MGLLLVLLFSVIFSRFLSHIYSQPKNQEKHWARPFDFHGDIAPQASSFNRIWYFPVA